MAANQTIKPLEMYDLVHNTAKLLGKSHLKKFLKEFGTRKEYAYRINHYEDYMFLKMAHDPAKVEAL